MGSGMKCNNQFAICSLWNLIISITRMNHSLQFRTLVNQMHSMFSDICSHGISISQRWQHLSLLRCIQWYFTSYNLPYSMTILHQKHFLMLYKLWHSLLPHILLLGLNEYIAVYTCTVQTVKQTPFNTILETLFEYFNTFDHDVNIF